MAYTPPIIIPTGPSLDRAEKLAIEELDRQLATNAALMIRELFTRQGPHRNSQGHIVWPEGPMWALLKERIEYYVLSDKFEEKLQARIEVIADTQADEALRLMLLSASRRRVFGAVPYKKDEA